MSPLPASIARCRSWIVNTDSSSTIGTGTRLRSSACPARSHAGSGCSRNSRRTPAASHASTADVAVARSQAWFASTRTGLVAVRWIAITRSTSDGSSPTLIFTWSNVDAAGPFGSHAAPCAAIVTSVPTGRAAPPRNLASGTPAARASRSCTAISVAARAPPFATTASASLVCTSPAGSSIGSRSSSRSASGPSTHASMLACDSPVTRQICGASPNPTRPSASVTRTTTLNTCSVRRRAVTKGVCRGRAILAVATWTMRAIASSAPR